MFVITSCQSSTEDNKWIMCLSSLHLFYFHSCHCSISSISTVCICRQKLHISALHPVHHLSALTVCWLQTQLAVIVCQCNTVQMKLQLQSIKIHDAKHIRQTYYTIRLHDSGHSSIIHQNTLVRRGGIFSILWALTWLDSVAKKKQEAAQISFLLALPSGLQTNPLSFPDRHRKRGGNTGPRSPVKIEPPRTLSEMKIHVSLHIMCEHVDYLCLRKLISLIYRFQPLLSTVISLFLSYFNYYISQGSKTNSLSEEKMHLEVKSFII